MRINLCIADDLPIVNINSVMQQIYFKSIYVYRQITLHLKLELITYALHLTLSSTHSSIVIPLAKYSWECGSLHWRWNQWGMGRWGGGGGGGVGV